MANGASVNPKSTSEKELRSKLLKAIGESHSLGISDEDLLRILRERLEEGGIYDSDERQRVAKIAQIPFLADNGYLLLSAAFRPHKKEFEKIFDKDVVNLAEHVPVFRSYGWDLSTTSRARPVEGDFLEVVDDPVKLLRIYRDGLIIAAGSISPNFLSWGTEEVRKSEEKLYINALAAVEYITNFVQFVEIFRVLAEIKVGEVIFSLELHKKPGEAGLLIPRSMFKKAIGNFAGQDKTFYFSPVVIGEMGLNYEKAAYPLVERFYQLFGVMHEDFHYVDTEHKTVIVSSFGDKT